MMMIIMIRSFDDKSDLLLFGPGNINVTKLQKIALLGSARILRKVLSIK